MRGNFRENLRDARRHREMYREFLDLDIHICISTRDSLRYEVVYYFQRPAHCGRWRSGTKESYSHMGNN